MFYIEALSVIIQVTSRYAFGRKVFAMAPLHHHFELKGWSEEKTVMRFWWYISSSWYLGFGWRYTDIIRINESYSNATNYEYGILALGRKKQ